MQRRKELHGGLPQLSPEEKAVLDCELTLEELTIAVNQMASGRAPGIDGLSTDFYKWFWNTSGPDLHGILEQDVFLSPVSEQCFPCCPRKEIWPYLRTGDQLPSSVQTIRCFPEPYQTDLRTFWK